MKQESQPMQLVRVGHKLCAVIGQIEQRTKDGHVINPRGGLVKLLREIHPEKPKARPRRRTRNVCIARALILRAEQDKKR